MVRWCKPGSPWTSACAQCCVSEDGEGRVLCVPAVRQKACAVRVIIIIIIIFLFGSFSEHLWIDQDP